MALISARRVRRSSIASAGRIDLQQAHRALDVDADRARIDVRRRNQHAADRRAVAAVRIGIEHQVGHARREPRVDRLLQAEFVERAANRLGADHGDRLGALPPVGRIAVASPVGMQLRIVLAVLMT